MAHFYYPSRNKYRNVRQTYNGNTYHSKKEAEYAAELDSRKRAKDIKNWRKQEKIELYAYGKLICNYYIDFVIEHNDGTEEYVEVKGFETEVWRLKWKMFEAKMKQEKPRAIITLARV